MDMSALEMLKGMRLLYVEDDTDTREELAMMLEPWVVELDVAADGQAGLDLYARRRHDIVITDVQMPIMSGLAMGAEIRRLDPQQPIVVLSAYNDVEYLFHAIELGINQYITKPVNVERLLERLADIARGILALREQVRNRRLLEQYRLLADESAIVTTLHPSGRITYVNDRLAQLTGHDKRELIGMDMALLRHPEESSTRLEDIWKSVLSGNKWAGIVKNRARDGKLLVLERSLVPIINEFGQVEEIFSLDVDITDIYTSAEVLMEALSLSDHSLQEQRDYLAAYKRALETGTSICIADGQGHIISANRQFADLLGYSVRELCELELPEVVPQCDILRLEAPARVDESPDSNVMSVYHKSGKELFFNIVCVPLKMADSNLESVILVCQDVTQSLQLTRELMETQRDLLMLVGQVVENRSLETGLHVKRVGEIARLLAVQWGLDGEQADMIRMAAPLHDVGKVGIPDTILHKPGRLDAAEFEVMKAHAAMGYQILSQIDRPLVRLAARIAYEHHERYDGKGYPRGLKDGEISIEGRIVAVADVLDALAHARSYKASWDDEAIRAYFQDQRGHRFDPMLVDLVFASWDDICAIRARYSDE
jgi:PAS domain S-box-containing protein